MGGDPDGRAGRARERPAGGRIDCLGFEVELPWELGPTDSGADLEVVFEAPVLREVGTFFDGPVYDDTRPHAVREIDSGILTVTYRP